MRNQVQLMTYADRLGGDLPGLLSLLQGPLAGLFGGVHVLPFFTPIDGADAGFDPIDHAAVDPRLGTWEDVAALGGSVELMADLIVNHASAQSPQFLDFLAHGAASRYAGMFLTLGKVFPGGTNERELLRIYRPRPGLPFTTVTLADRSRRIAWTTFTASQMDLDVADAETQRYLRRILERFADSGVSVVRLDAVGYAVKTPGTSCFLTPGTFALVDQLAAVASALGIEVLVEVHAHYERQIAIAAQVEWVYDFALPPLVLHALSTGDGRALRRWLALRPRNAVTVLDTHDGIGVLDVGADGETGRAGLLEPEAISALVDAIHQHSGGQSRQATGAAASNVDVYQVNCTYYDALGRRDDDYLLARLLQLFTPGIPQIYYVGLLFGTNDIGLLHRTGVGRDINRHVYTPDEIVEALQRPAVRRLLALIRLRNTHPSFGGEWTLRDTPDHQVAMRWQHDQHVAELAVDLRARTFTLRLSDGSTEQTLSDLGALPSH